MADRSIWQAARDLARSVGRKLTPPGNREPLDESGAQRPGVASSDVTPSLPGLRGGSDGELRP